MKKFVAVVFLMTFLFSLESNAQNTNFLKLDTSKFLVSEIVAVKAPDEDDLKFIAVSVREELIRARKIKFSKEGDTLFVSLISEYPKINDSFRGRNGKYGELTIFIRSKNGNAASTASGYLGNWESENYYSRLQSISKNLAERFEFVK